MKYTYKDLITMKQVMLSMVDSKNKSFSYALERNLVKVDSCIKLAHKRIYFDPAFCENKKFEKYIKLYAALEEKYGQKDEESNLVRNEEGVIIPLDVEKYTADLQELDKKHPGCSKVLSDRKAVIKKNQESEFEIDFYKIKDENGLPDDISLRQRFGLWFMFADSLIPKDEEVENGN